jgi:hypothetical protein
LFQDKEEDTIASIQGGNICLVTHIATGQQYAWKATETLKGEDGKAKEEASIAHDIHSPFIVPIGDFLC